MYVPPRNRTQLTANIVISSKHSQAQLTASIVTRVENDPAAKHRRRAQVEKIEDGFVETESVGEKVSDARKIRREDLQSWVEGRTLA